MSSQNSQSEGSGDVRHFGTNDADELAQAQPAKNRRYTQLGRGRLRGDLFELRLPGLQIFRERLSVGMWVEAAPSPNLVPFALLSDGSELPRFCSRELQHGALAQATGGTWDVRFDHALDYVSCVFERERFERAGCDLLGRPIDPRWLVSAVRPADPVAVARLRKRMHRLLSGFAVPPPPGTDRAARLEAELLGLTIAALTSGQELARIGPAWRRRRAVRRVLELLDAAESPLPTIPELCGVAGVSQRTLEYGFIDLLGVTPVRYLNLLRLNRARRALRKATRGHQTVTGIAMRLGFSNPSRFAHDYRRLFGEPPSSTLRASLR